MAQAQYLEFEFSKWHGVCIFLTDEINKMKRLIVLFILPLLAFGTMHKFYVSVTNINYSEKDGAFQITTRIFIDDLQAVLKERYDFETKLATEEEGEMTDFYVEKYLRAKFLLLLDDEVASYTFLGKKYDNDVVICYLEVPEVALDRAETFEIQNEILTDLFEEQKNLVHVKWKGKKKSFILIKSNAKGMLNL